MPSINTIESLVSANKCWLPRSPADGMAGRGGFGGPRMLTVAYRPWLTCLVDFRLRCSQGLEQVLSSRSP